ncbi:acetylglutamate kinase [Loigolactobacillus backii]|uniref:acetylglutamate kinase n=1 Tax=Loigolactobacillus backii TaxID=375175 RepID=UPI000C1CAC9F|nr:acetylglutamate kinase [Loigolactobacillus backii]PIO82702.1 acetylglutamate kinase [Loigolactobacillus backii]
MTQTIVIKVGGNAINELDANFFNQLRQWREAGKQILIVHGGGPIITEWSKKLHLSVKKINGIRVTDQAVLAVTKAVLLGLIQPQLLSKLSANNLLAIGLNASDQHLLVGETLNQSLYGEVGKITQVNLLLLRQLLQKQIVVLAPLAQTKTGDWLNVNADLAAAEIASQLNATKLVLMTDVPGVMTKGQVMSHLNWPKAQQLLGKQIIKTGMAPKIKAAFQALNKGVAQALITDDLAHAGTTLTTVATD